MRCFAEPGQRLQCYVTGEKRNIAATLCSMPPMIYFYKKYKKELTNNLGGCSAKVPGGIVAKQA